MAEGPDENMFRPPLAHGMKALDRAFFQRTVPLKAARIFENKDISKIRTQLEKSKDALAEPRLGSVHPDPDGDRAKSGKKCVLLRPQVKNDSARPLSSAGETNGHVESDERQAEATPWPHSSVLTELANQGLIAVVPYNLLLDYKYWTYHDVISAILPPSAQEEIPSGFSQVGHVAHLNLREAYLPYKHLIAEILMDKNPTVKTVINKIDDVGEENEYRTFKYEVLAGPDDMNVTVSEENCTFVFDYSKVYWNTRLNTEHKRLVAMFREGEAVCDVMAGIGPFAVPAGKKRVFVWANDLNPDSHASLTDAVKRNRVADFAKPFNTDGRKFIREAAGQLIDDERKVDIKKKISRKDRNVQPEIERSLVQPKTFQHFVLNLPASALTFLSSFVGLYTPEMRQKLAGDAKMPLVHVYCFSTKDGQDPSVEQDAAGKICAEISSQLGHEMKPGPIDQGGVEVYDVRDVAPKKRMFCASFRLPETVAFGSHEG